MGMDALWMSMKARETPMIAPPKPHENIIKRIHRDQDAGESKKAYITPCKHHGSS